MISQVSMCRLACDSDVVKVTDVHIAAFPGFFLTKLGPKFLRTMYQAFLLNSGGVFVVNEMNGTVQGFAVGIMKSAGNDRLLAMRFLPKFLLSLLPAMACNPIMVSKRVITHFFSVRDEPDIPDDAAVLRSIGVRPAMQGNGIANRLLEEFEQLAQNKGATSVALTTDAVDNARAIGFYRKHGYNIAYEFKQDKKRTMLLMVKYLVQ